MPKKAAPDLQMHGYHYKDGTPVTFPEPRKQTKARRSNSRVLPANAFSDFRMGIDRVVRHGDWCWIVPGDGPRSYEPAQVLSDKLTDDGRRKLEALTPEQRRIMARVIQGTPFLSSEGKQERLEWLRFVSTKWTFEIVGSLSLPGESGSLSQQTTPQQTAVQTMGEKREGGTRA